MHAPLTANTTSLTGLAMQPVYTMSVSKNGPGASYLMHLHQSRDIPEETAHSTFGIRPADFVMPIWNCAVLATKVSQRSFHLR